MDLTKSKCQHAATGMWPVDTVKLQQWLSQMRSGLWSGWPDAAYQRESYQQRLLAVQEHLADCLDIAPPGALRVISVCAGDGRDVIGVLRTHRRRNDVTAWLIELDRQSVAAGVQRATNAGLEGVVNFLNADATVYVTYKGIVPSNVVLICGVWGHVPPHERSTLIRAVTSFCNPGGTVVWTRGVSNGMSRLREIQSYFVGPNWDELRLSLTSNKKWVVSTHRFCGTRTELPASGRIFHFQRSAG